MSNLLCSIRMDRRCISPLLLTVLCAVSIACGASNSSDVAPQPTPDVTVDVTVDAAENTPVCDATKRPFVFVHGFLASGDTIANHAMRFEANGYCLDRVYAFDWNTLNQGEDHTGALDAFIDAALAETGAAQVDLAGHSAGGSLGYSYLATPAHAAKVAHYVHIGSQIQSGPAGAPTLNLWSESDVIITDKGDIPGATNEKLLVEDHYSVATSALSFDAMYRFINDGEAPTTTDITPHPTRTVQGKVLTLGENIAGVNTAVDIYECDSETGFRKGDTPTAALVTDAKGQWGPFEAAADVGYEFHVHSDSPDSRPVHYYFEPFERSNPFVYLRTLPGPGSLAGMLVGGLPQTESSSTVVVFSASHAMLAGTDSLTIDGVELLTPESAAAQDTLLALFLFDGNENGQSDLEPSSLFGFIPFLNGVDIHVPTETMQTVTLKFNGRTLNARNWPTEPDGPIIAVFR